jgi:hypothetical protein
MKAWKVLAVVLASLAMPGCVSKEKPAQAAAQPAPGGPSPEQHAIVARLLDAHQETVEQMRVSSALRAQHKVECN